MIIKHFIIQLMHNIYLDTSKVGVMAAYAAITPTLSMSTDTIILFL